jgi:hypothetical protein
MRQRVEIYDSTDGNVLAFDLREVLSALPPAASQLEWYLLDLEATGSGPNHEPIIDFERAVASSQHGVKLGWDELHNLAENVTQTINATLVGTSAELPPPSLPLSTSYPAPVIIEAIDSSLWAVASPNAEVVESILRSFGKTKMDATTENRGR